jgi:hypothetical protein
MDLDKKYRESGSEKNKLSGILRSVFRRQLYRKARLLHTKRSLLIRFKISTFTEIEE